MAVLEAALVLPMILALIFASIEFAYVFYVKHTLQAAAREGARRGIVEGANNSHVEQAVDAAMDAGGLGESIYTVTVLDDSNGQPASVSSIAAGEGVCVEVSAPWTQYSVFLSGLGDWARGELKSRTTMRREG